MGSSGLALNTGRKKKMIKKIQKLATLPEGRPETGAMSFGDDWPGVFIRGDNAFAYALALRSVVANAKHDRIDWLTLGILEDFAELLESCRVE